MSKSTELKLSLVPKQRILVHSLFRSAQVYTSSPPKSSQDCCESLTNPYILVQLSGQFAPSSLLAQDAPALMSQLPVLHSLQSEGPTPTQHDPPLQYPA